MKTSKHFLGGFDKKTFQTSSNDNRNTFAPPTIVSDDQWQISACPVSGSSMTVNQANILKIIWYTAGKAGTPGIYQAESSDGGKSFSPRRPVSDLGGSGTPTILPDADGSDEIVFAGIDKNTYLLTEPNKSGSENAQIKIDDADLPAAAVANGKVYIAFVRKVNDKRNVFLLSK